MTAEPWTVEAELSGVQAKGALAELVRMPRVVQYSILTGASDTPPARALLYRMAVTAARHCQDRRISSGLDGVSRVLCWRDAEGKPGKIAVELKKEGEACSPA